MRRTAGAAETRHAASAKAHIGDEVLADELLGDEFLSAAQHFSASGQSQFVLPTPVQSPKQSQ